MTPTKPNASDSPTEPIQVEHRYDATIPPSIAIVRSIAAIEDVDPVDSPRDLGITLFEQIDPEALDRLLTDDGGGGAVTVDLTLQNGHRYTVHVEDTGRLVVRK